MHAAAKVRRALLTVLCVRDCRAPDEGQLWDWFFGLFKFLLFVTIFTILMVYFRPSDAINAYTVMFKSVISAAPDDFNFISDVWDFLNGPVMSLLEPDYFSVMKGYWPEDLHQYIHGNRMLGSVRLRQIRTTDSDCPTLHKHFLAADSTLQKHCLYITMNVSRGHWRS